MPKCTTKPLWLKPCVVPCVTASPPSGFSWRCQALSTTPPSAISKGSVQGSIPRWERWESAPPIITSHCRSKESKLFVVWRTLKDIRTYATRYCPDRRKNLPRTGQTRNMPYLSLLHAVSFPVTTWVFPALYPYYSSFHTYFINFPWDKTHRLS